MMRREALVAGNVQELSDQLREIKPDYSLGKDFLQSFRSELYPAEELVIDDMSAALPGLGIAPAGVVGG